MRATLFGLLFALVWMWAYRRRFIPEPDALSESSLRDLHRRLAIQELQDSLPVSTADPCPPPSERGPATQAFVREIDRNQKRGLDK